MMKINERVLLKFIGEDDPIKLRTGKIYHGRVLQLGWFGVVDETGEEYAYPPQAFEVLGSPYIDHEQDESGGQN